jgi:hypothetical protein
VTVASDESHKPRRAVQPLLDHQEFAYRRAGTKRADELLQYLNESFTTLTDLGVGPLAQDLTTFEPWPDGSWWSERYTRSLAYLTATALRERANGHDCVKEITEIDVKIGEILSTINLRTDNATVIHARIGS